MHFTKEELKTASEFSKDFNSFKKVDVELPVNLIQKIKILSNTEQYKGLGFDGTLSALLSDTLKNDNLF